MKSRDSSIAVCLCRCGETGPAVSDDRIYRVYREAGLNEGSKVRVRLAQRLASNLQSLSAERLGGRIVPPTSRIALLGYSGCRQNPDVSRPDVDGTGRRIEWQ